MINDTGSGTADIREWKKPVILFHGYHKAVLKEYFALFSYPAFQKKFRLSCIIEDTEYSNIRLSDYPLIQEDIQVITYNKTFEKQGKLITLFENLLQATINVLMLPFEIIFHLHPAMFFNNLIVFNRIQRYSDFIIREINPSLVLAYSDRAVGLESALIQSAHKRKIPVLAIPVSYSDPVTDVKNRINNPDFLDLFSTKTVEGRIFSNKFPAWIMSYHGTQAFFRPPMEMLATRVIGWMPENPWINVGTGWVDRICVESRREYDRLVDSGIPKNKLAITGKASSDLLYQCIVKRKEKRSAICETLGLNSDKKILLCSLPQLAEHNLMDWEQHWHEIDFLLETFNQLPDTQVLISLHPKCNPALYRERLRRNNAVLGSRYPIEELIPIADVFVATISTTVFMAVASSVPVVIINFYKLADSLFENEKTFDIVKDKSRLLPFLLTLLAKPIMDSSKTIPAEKNKDYWSLVDGNSRRRLFQEIQKILAFGPIEECLSKF